MSDIDDDLLALAGGAVSSDEEEEASMNLSRGASRSPPRPKETPTKSVATKKASASQANAQARSQESEEEGEASSAASSPRSTQSVPMDESDSEDDNKQTKAHDDDENKYPIDGLFLSHAEKAQIMSMREVEREQILAEREQEKEKMHQNRLLRQLVSNNEAQKKRTASTAGLDDDRRKGSRVRTKLGGTRVGETNSALDTLKRARAEKNERTRRREEDKERAKDRSPSYRDGYDNDGDADSEIEWASPSKAKDKATAEAKKELDRPAELEDIQRIRLSRTRFGQVCFHPGFEEKMKGCFVRISIGRDPESGDNVYRMAIIKAIVKGKEYATDGPRGTIVTDQYVTAAHGKSTRDWPFIMCSDGDFTESEWKRYKIQCEIDAVPLPMKSDTDKKIDDINSLLRHSWTEQELSDKLERTRKLKYKFQGYDRLHLEREIEECRALGLDEKVKALQEKLDNFETPRLAFRTSLTPHKKSSSAVSNGGVSQQERLAQLNAENRKRNRDAVRKAQLKERAHLEQRKLERSQSQGSATPDKLARAGAGAGSQNHAASGTSTPANGGTPKLLPHLLKLQQQQQSSKSGLPTIHKPLMDDDIIGALDLDIDEDILS